MPEMQIFPAWVTSPYFMYGVPGVLGFLMLVLIIAGNWRTLTFLVLMVVVGTTLFMGFFWKTLNDFMTNFPIPPAPILAQTAAMHPFDDRIESVGTTEANESTALTSTVSDTVREIAFNEGQFVKAGTVIARLEDDEEQASLTEAQRAYQRSAELARTKAVSAARVDADRARLDTIRAQIKDRQIIVPFDGILGLRSISVGDIVNPGTVITTLDDIDPIKLEFSVPEKFISAISPGMPIEAKAEAWPNLTFEGAVHAIDPRVDPVSRALRVKAEIANPEGKLRAGMLMTVDIVQNRRQALAVSEEALVSKGLEKSVHILGPADAQGLSSVETRTVKVGTRRPGYVEILEGLQPGEKIIVDGIIKVEPGVKVKVIGERDIGSTVTQALDNAVQGKQVELEAAGVKREDAPPAQAGPEPAPSPSNEVAP